MSEQKSSEGKEKGKRKKTIQVGAKSLHTMITSIMTTYFCTIAMSPWPVQITSMALLGREEYRLLTLSSIRRRMFFSSEVTLYIMLFLPVGLLHVSNEIISAIFVFSFSSLSICFLK